MYVYDYEESSRRLDLVQEVTDIENPAFFCLSPDGRFLHSAWELPLGRISSYARAPVDGTLTLLGARDVGGSWASYLAMDSGGRVVLAADYDAGRVVMFPTRADGSLAEASSVHQLVGNGPVPMRQDGPHAHCIITSPDETYAFVADLGADRIVCYRIDWDRLELVPHSELELARGTGPRHLVFAPGGRYAYLVGELEATLSALAYDAAAGTFTHVETYPLLPADFTGEKLSADVHVHPSGRWVYASNRGHDSIAIFAIDPGSGRLRSLGHRSSEGATPRNFAISPDGRFLLVANQDTDTIVTMPIDPDSGLLGETVAVMETPTPVCLVFAPA